MGKIALFVVLGLAGCGPTKCDDYAEELCVFYRRCVAPVSQADCQAKQSQGFRDRHYSDAECTMFSRILDNIKTCEQFLTSVVDVSR